IDPNASEVGLDPGVFRFTRVGDLTFSLTATFTIGGTAGNGSDYVGIAANVVFAAGQSTADVTITPKADALVEGPETVILTLTDGADYDVGTPATATVTIADNTAPIGTVEAIDPDASEVALDPGLFRFTRVGDLTSALSVTFTIGGTASS